MSQGLATRTKRPPRVKLVGTILALVQLESGRQIQARIHQLSVTGGLLYLEDPLNEAIKVELAFHIGSSTVRAKAVMLFPMWATQGYLQPFEFVDLAEEDKQKLAADLQTFLEQAASAQAARPAPLEAPPTEIQAPEPEEDVYTSIEAADTSTPVEVVQGDPEAGSSSGLDTEMAGDALPPSAE